MPLNVINNCGGLQTIFSTTHVTLYSCSDYGMLHSKPALEDRGELLFLDLDFVLLASSRNPNFTGRHLFWLGLRVVGILHIFYSRAVIQRQIDASPAFMEYGLAKKIAA
jgi:hypothetical protein